MKRVFEKRRGFFRSRGNIRIPSGGKAGRLRAQQCFQRGNASAFLHRFDQIEEFTEFREALWFGEELLQLQALASKRE